MKEVIEKIVLKDRINFIGQIEDLKKKLNNSANQKFRVEWISSDEFKFISRWSIGTLIVKGFPNKVGEIKGYGKIQKSENNVIEIDLMTKVRIELYFTIGIFIFFFIASFFIEENIPIWIYLLLPIILLWFWFIYRLQENWLFNRFKEYLRI